MSSYPHPTPGGKPQIPLPSLQTLLDRTLETSTHLFPPSSVATFKAATDALFTESSPNSILAHIPAIFTEIDRLSKINPDGNWMNAWFERLLLSTRHPVANTIRIGVLVEYERTVGELVRAIAVWGRYHVWAEEGDKRKEQYGRGLAWQVGRYWAAYREVGEKVDEMNWVDKEEVLKKGGSVVVWYRGLAWELRVIGEDGQTLSSQAIQSQVDEIYAAYENLTEVQKKAFKLAAASWRRGRTEWWVLKNELLKDEGNKVVLNKIYGSLFSIAIDEFTPEMKNWSTAERVNDIREGTNSENRFSDAMLTTVLYKGSNRVGFTFDHTPADCGSVLEFTKAILDIVPNLSAYPVSTSTPSSPTILTFKTQGIGPDVLEIPPKYTDPIPRVVQTWSHPGTSATLTSHRLYDPLLLLSLHSVLHQTRPVETATTTPIFQPVWLRHTLGGRTDPFCPISKNGTAFLEKVFAKDVLSETQDDETFELLDKYLKDRKRFIDQRTDGVAPNLLRSAFLHPLLCRLQRDETISPETREIITTYLNHLNTVSGAVREAQYTGRAPVQFTGFNLVNGVEAEDEKNRRDSVGRIVVGQSNIYLDGQMVVFYVVRDEGVEVLVQATGGLKEGLEETVRLYKQSFVRLLSIFERFVAWRERKGEDVVEELPRGG